MIRFGPHFYPTGMKPEITSIFCIIDSTLKHESIIGILSSGVDRKHGVKSLHYVGLAVDITWEGFQYANGTLNKDIRDELKYILGPHYDVVLEDDHVHIEYQPKVAINEQWRR